MGAAPTVPRRSGATEPAAAPAALLRPFPVTMPPPRPMPPWPTRPRPRREADTIPWGAVTAPGDQRSRCCLGVDGEGEVRAGGDCQATPAQVEPRFLLAQPTPQPGPGLSMERRRGQLTRGRQLRSCPARLDSWCPVHPILPLHDFWAAPRVRILMLEKP